MSITAVPLVVHSTITKHLKEVDDSCMRNRVAFAMMKSKGRITYNGAGKDMDWRVKLRIPDTIGYSDMDQVTYATHDKYVVPTLGWAASLTTDAMSMMQQMMNKGPQAIIKHLDTIMPDLEKSLVDDAASQLFIDGNATGNEKKFSGLNTFLTATTPGAADTIATPNDSYGGFNTNLGDQGGTWSADGTANNSTLANDWPDGTGDYEYDYYAPKLVNWSSTGWGTGLTTFRANAEYALRSAISWCTVSGGKDGSIDLFLTTSKLFTDYKNSQAARQQINVQPTTSPLWALGFRDIMNLDGVDITSDYNVPVNCVYGLNFDYMRMDNLHSQMFWSHEPEYDPHTLATLFVMGMFGQYRFKPKAFCLLKNYA